MEKEIRAYSVSNKCGKKIRENLEEKSLIA